MSNIPVPGQLYRHFKGQLYRIVTLAKDSETGENMVVYQALYGDYEVYVRPLSMFVEKVDRNQYPNVVQEYRFELQKELLGMPAHGNVEPEPLEEREETIEKNVAVTWNAGEKAEETITPSMEVEEVERETKTKSITAVTEDVEDVYKPEDAVTDDTEEQEEFNIDPLVLEFLDAGTYRERLNILSALHHRITDGMITTMAIASDLEVGDGDVEQRYEELRNCLMTHERYEGRRLR
ncbi:DUF1653 domain-containing protein [Parablautia muri]|uniref:DUF1653 domain-containing protein n=1 Tax=Parablautia muri TaxID=2320879 RepID=UPI00241266F2|nr:DUF1653 domain-containing protein [Parablautia muri]